MRSVITVSVPRLLKKQIDLIATQTSVNRSQIIQQAIDDYLTKYQFLQLRKRAVRRAQAQGLYTDEDIFQKVS